MSILETPGIPDKPHDPAFEALISFLRQVPAVDSHMGSGYSDGGRWWVKFVIDIKHPLAWRVVQELGHVLNYVSVEDRLPTVFKPVSPPPYMNGGPEDFCRGSSRRVMQRSPQRTPPSGWRVVFPVP
jgi:hypothetical protein